MSIETNSSLAALVDLRLLPLRISARALGPVHLPEHPGSALRGAFGDALRRLVCVHPGRGDCPDCTPARCVYPSLFAPRAEAEQAGTSGFQDLPRPYVIRPGEATAIAPGQPFTWDVTLVGSAIEQLAYFVLGWRGMGEAGIGRGRGQFRLEAVDVLDLNGAAGERIYERSSNRLAPATGALGGPDFTQWAEAAPGERVGDGVVLRFVSPTSLKTQGRPVETPLFPVVWRSVQLRLSLLRLAYGDGRPDVDFAATIRAAESVRLEEWHARPVAWERYSHRQGRRVPMRGFIGAARYAGDLRPFLPALKAGSLVGIGDNCTFGQGIYEIVGSTE